MMAGVGNMDFTCQLGNDWSQGRESKEFLENTPSSDDRFDSERLERPWQHDSGTYAESGEIGTGAYATVSRGRNTITGQDVAIKKITLPVSHEGVPQSVIREISLLKRFERYHHPNIVRLLDVCHGLSPDGHKLYMNLVFEFCPQDLSMFFESAAPIGILAESTIRRMFHELVAGVKFLHDNAVVHRDLKPQNILITADGHLKVADYGLARTYSLRSALTTVVVTLWYRSPELLLQCDYGMSVDIWSLGCILAEFYRLNALFRGSTELDQLVKIFQVLGVPSPANWPRESIVDRSSFIDLRVNATLRQKVRTASPMALDLILNMLKMSPDQRITINGILQHPYFIETAIPTTSAYSTSSSSCSNGNGF